MTTPSHWSSKMSEINLDTFLWKYDFFVIIILVCLIFKLCLINEHLRKML